MRDFGARLRVLSPRKILLIGWLAFLVYAFPGFMSFDSITQLRESRSGYYIDGHPPAMAALWRVVELFVAGPAGMLLIQSACFIVGGYLLFARFMSQRRAALAASLVLVFPPIAAVMGVIWKDSQMAGFLVLGLGLIVQDRRRTKLFGLLAFVAATAMRYNALVITGPLIVVCFAWDARHGFIKRHLISIAAWIAVTLSAQVISSALTDEKQYIWHTSLALCDMAATLRYTDDTIPDAELERAFAGIQLKQTHDLHAFARRDDNGVDYIDNLWKTAYKLFELPRDAEGRAAVTRAWKTIVFGHFGSYLAYRWEIFRRLLGLADVDPASPVYNWFTDIQDSGYSAQRADHDAGPSRIQDELRRGIHVVGVTPIFHVMLYAILALLLIPFSFCDRRAFALLASAITSEGVLFLITPTTDWRYSFWLITAVVMAAIVIVAVRMRSRAAEPKVVT